MKAILRTLCGCSKEIDLRQNQPPPSYAINYMHTNPSDFENWREVPAYIYGENLPIKQRFFDFQKNVNGVPTYVERGA